MPGLCGSEFKTDCIFSFTCIYRPLLVIRLYATTCKRWHDCSRTPLYRFTPRVSMLTEMDCAAICLSHRVKAYYSFHTQVVNRSFVCCCFTLPITMIWNPHSQLSPAYKLLVLCSYIFPWRPWWCWAILCLHLLCNVYLALLLLKKCNALFARPVFLQRFGGSRCTWGLWCHRRSAKFCSWKD